MIDAIIVGIYILAVLCVGIYCSRGIKSMREFSLANRNFPGPVIMATISATFIGAEFIFGFAQQSFSVGIIFLFPLLGWFLCKIFIAQSIVPRVARYANAISVGDIMAEDYGKVGRVVTGLSAACLSIGFVGAQISACGVLFQYFFDVPNVLGILIGCTLVVVYSSLGGFRAVAFTDFLQFAVLIVAVPLICNFELSKIGGFASLFEALPATHIIPDRAVIPEQIAWFIIFLIPLLDPAIMQRILMDRDPKKIAKAFRLSALTDIPIYLVVCVIGLIALIKNPGLDPNLAFPHIMSELPVGIAGLAITGVLAVIMSTADSFLNVASISLVHDVIKPLFLRKISERQELRLAQLSTAVLGTVAILAALTFPRILDLIIYFQNISWVPLVMVPLYAAIFGLKANSRSFILSGICGIGSQFLWPLIFGATPELSLAGISLLGSACGLVGGHAYFGGKWPESGKTRSRSWPLKTRAESSLVNTLKAAPKLLLSLPRFCTKRVEAFGASYSLFGLFAVLNYIVPYFMWSSSATEHFGIHLFMRLAAGGLCVALFVHEYWPATLQKYLPFYWHLTLLYCLPFFATFMLLDNACSNFWLCNLVLALFLLASLVDWLSFIVLLIAGAFLGYGVFLLLGDYRAISLDRETLYSVIYMYSFAIVIGLLFSRRNEKISKEKMAVLQSFTAYIAHEMRTPLATISVNAQNMARLFPKYAASYSMAKNSGLSIPELSAFEQSQLKEVPVSIERVSKDAQSFIDMLLMKVSSPAATNAAKCSVISCVDAALSQYPFNSTSAKIIHWNKGSDIYFFGSEHLFIHVIFNLIKNSLEATAGADDAQITIWTEHTHGENALHFKDNGKGIPKHIMAKVFERFVSDSENGTGMGLAYCKMAMRGLGGDIICKSIEGQGTEFILSF